MRNSLKKILSLTLLIFSISTVYATELASCNSCSFLTQKNLAKNLINSGRIIIYDPINKNSQKFFVFTSVEPGFSFKDAYATNMTDGEFDFINTLFYLYDELGDSFKTTEITIPIGDIGVGTEFNGLNAYDIFSTGRYRNILTDAINKDIGNILSGNTAARNLFGLIVQAIESALNIDLSIKIIVVFEDGSQIVIEVSVDNGGKPRHNRDDPDNRDANKNPILNSNDSSEVGVYTFTNNNQLQDFLEAAWLYGIPITNGGSGGGGRMVCRLEGKILKCIYYPK